MNEISILKDELTPLGFDLIVNLPEKIDFINHDVIIRFLKQRWEGWECYIIRENNSPIPVNFLVFLFKNSNNRSQSLDFKKLELKDLFLKKNGVIDIIRDSKLLEYLEWYELNSKKINEQMKNAL